MKVGATAGHRLGTWRGLIRNCSVLYLTFFVWKYWICWLLILGKKKQNRKPEKRKTRLLPWVIFVWVPVCLFVCLFLMSGMLSALLHRTHGTQKAQGHLTLASPRPYEYTRQTESPRPCEYTRLTESTGTLILTQSLQEWLFLVLPCFLIISLTEIKKKNIINLSFSTTRLAKTISKTV